MSIKTEYQRLSSSQLDACKKKALSRVHSRLNDKPRYEQFYEKNHDGFGFLDILALLVFVSALAMSSIHVFEYVSHIIPNDTEPIGLSVGFESSVRLHQLGFLILSETTMILMMVLHGTVSHDMQGFRRYVSLPSVIAISSALFIITANLSSGLTIFASLLIPLCTIGIGSYLESKIIRTMMNKREATQKYEQALNEWERSSKDATQHSSYTPFLREAIFENLLKLKSNSHLQEIDPSEKLLIANAEMNQFEWANDFLAGNKILQIG